MPLWWSTVSCESATSRERRRTNQAVGISWTRLGPTFVDRRVSAGSEAFVCSMLPLLMMSFMYGHLNEPWEQLLPLKLLGAKERGSAMVDMQLAPDVCAILESANVTDPDVLFPFAMKAFPIPFSHSRHIIGSWVYYNHGDKKAVFASSLKYLRWVGGFGDSAFNHGVWWASVGPVLRSNQSILEWFENMSLYVPPWHSIGHGIGTWAFGLDNEVALCKPVPYSSPRDTLLAARKGVHICVRELGHAYPVRDCLQALYMQCFQFSIDAHNGRMTIPGSHKHFCEELACWSKKFNDEQIVNDVRFFCWARWYQYAMNQNLSGPYCAAACNYRTANTAMQTDTYVNARIDEMPLLTCAKWEREYRENVVANSGAAELADVLVLLAVGSISARRSYLDTRRTPLL